MSSTQSQAEVVRQLWRERPRSRLLSATVWGMILWSFYSWLSPEIGLLNFLDSRRLSNLNRFVETELVPFPMRGGQASWQGLFDWVADIWTRIGTESTIATLQISILAIVIAGAAAWPLSLFAARNLASPNPFELQGNRATRTCRLMWGATTTVARGSAILLRAIPEFILAFLALAVLGPQSAWPAVIALAIHNGGILSRLGSEVIENLEPAPLRTLAVTGANRRGLIVLGVLPLSLSRNLLYFFYRFETCVREATVLGMLGVLSLGYWIQDARAKQFYDEVLLLVTFSVGLVLVADLLSALARRSIRR